MVADRCAFHQGCTEVWFGLALSILAMYILEMSTYSPAGKHTQYINSVSMCTDKINTLHLSHEKYMSRSNTWSAHWVYAQLSHVVPTQSVTNARFKLYSIAFIASPGEPPLSQRIPLHPKRCPPVTSNNMAAPGFWLCFPPLLPV